MFGGIGIYHDGLMFGLVAADDIFLKTDSDNVEAFRNAGSRPFAFEKAGRLTETSYLSVPDSALDEPDEMRSWAELAYAAALRKSGKPRR